MTIILHFCCCKSTKKAGKTSVNSRFAIKDTVNRSDCKSFMYVLVCVYFFSVNNSLSEPSSLWCLGGSLCWPSRLHSNHAFTTMICLAWSHVAVFFMRLLICGDVVLLHCVHPHLKLLILKWH